MHFARPKAVKKSVYVYVTVYSFKFLLFTVFSQFPVLAIQFEMDSIPMTSKQPYLLYLFVHLSTFQQLQLTCTEVQNYAGRARQVIASRRGLPGYVLAVTDLLSTWHIMLASTFPMSSNAKRKMLSCTRQMSQPASNSFCAIWPDNAEQSAGKNKEFVNIWLKKSSILQLSEFMRVAGKRSSRKNYFLRRNFPRIARKLRTVPISSWS